jgi:hypothetical protein
VSPHGSPASGPDSAADDPFGDVEEKLGLPRLGAGKLAGGGVIDVVGLDGWLRASAPTATCTGRSTASCSKPRLAPAPPSGASRVTSDTIDHRT